MDISRHVSDAIVDNWARMCTTLASRAGADKVGQKVLAMGYTASGIQTTTPALRPSPLQLVWIAPDSIHSVALNSAVACLSFVVECVLKADPHRVRTTCPTSQLFVEWTNNFCPPPWWQPRGGWRTRHC